MKLTIVIPVYNVEDYLSKCIDSCLNQNVSFEDYEVLIINDGSTDKSAQIAQDYASTYPNISFIDQENNGLSYTRNKGIQLAKGEYVWFVDSDDWIEKNIFQELLQETSKHPDIIAIPLKFQGLRNDAYDLLDFKKITGREFLKADKFPMGAQFYVFNREFLLKNNIKFVGGIYHEDCLFTPEALYKATEIIRFPRIAYYYYLRNNGSITSTPSLKRANDCIFITQQLFLTGDQNETLRNTFYDLGMQSLNAGIRIISKYFPEKISEIKSNLKRLKNHFKINRFNKRNYKIEASILRFCPYLIFKFYQR